MSGYSGTPLHKKLGFKEGFVAHVVDEPGHYPALVAGLPGGVRFVEVPAEASLDFAHLFVKERSRLAHMLPLARTRIKPAGMIWVSWPKKASKVITDMTEDVVRAEAFPLGLVDIKVCAVDDVWSGLKLVIRKELR
jgi:hypothetical protein